MLGQHSINSRKHSRALPRRRLQPRGRQETSRGCSGPGTGDTPPPGLEWGKSRGRRGRRAYFCTCAVQPAMAERAGPRLGKTGKVTGLDGGRGAPEGPGRGLAGKKQEVEAAGLNGTWYFTENQENGDLTGPASLSPREY